MFLYITGSYPNSWEGIADAAKILLDSMLKYIDKKNVRLLTTDVPIITEHISDNCIIEYDLMPDWHVNKRNIRGLYTILKQYDITVVHMEYPGDLYGKTFLASFIPYLICRYNKKNHTDIRINVRLHEFTRSRFLRKIAIIPILLYADSIYVPGKKDRETVKKIAGKRVHKTYIGTTITRNEKDISKPVDKKKTISYFGSVYPGKGIEHMLDIWLKIKKSDPDNRYIFKIIGDVGTEPENHFAEYHKQVWELIEQYGLKDSIKVTGYLSDAEVSREIRNSDLATLFYEDGLTLRRTSFLAYLAHGIPIVTSMGDADAIEFFYGHSGVAMTSSDEEIIQKMNEYLELNSQQRVDIQTDNINLSKNFDWDIIAKDFLIDYGIV